MKKQVQPVLFWVLLALVWCGIGVGEELPLSGGRWAGLEGVTVSGGEFRVTPRDAGAALVFDFDPARDMRPVRSVLLQVSGGGLQADDLALDLRGTEGQRVGAQPGLEAGEYYFPLEPVSAAVRQMRVYINVRKRHSGMPLVLAVERLTLRSEPLPVEVWHERLELVPHRRQFATTLLLPRIQEKYDLMMNYLGAYALGSGTFTDRPLFFDRTLAEEPLPLYDKLNSPASFCRQLQTALMFTDGLGLFGHARSERFRRPVEAATAAGFRQVLLLEEGPDSLRQEALMDQVLATALASPAMIRHDGKLVIGSYSGDRVSPEDFGVAAAALHRRYPGQLLIMVELRGLVYQINSAWRRGSGRLSQSQIVRFKARMRDYLAVADGIGFSGSNHLAAERPGFPEHVFNAACYRDIVVPLFCAVLNEDAYAGRKLLWLSAHKTYCQVRSTSSNIDEEGSRSLRESLSIALAARPDYIVMPEWNEINENTHMEPVVSDGLAIARIVQAVRGVPCRDERRSWPNLVLSFRQENDIAAPIPLELLGLPDPEAGEYGVTLRLLDPSGAVVKAFAEVVFSHRRIDEAFWLLPAGPYAVWRYLRPELLIRQNGETRSLVEGLPHVRLTTPPNPLHRYVRCALRDLPAAESVGVRVSCADGLVRARGRVVMDEPVNTVELLANDIPLAAVDGRAEYAPRPGLLLLRWVRQVPALAGYDQDTVRVAALHGRIEARVPHLYDLAGMAVPVQEGAVLSGPIGGGSSLREFLFYATPDARVEIVQRGEKGVVEVNALQRHGSWRQAGSGGVSWTLSVVRGLPQVPYPLGVNDVEVALQAPLAELEQPVYTLRIITASGRVFRTAPALESALTATGELVPFPVWDLLTEKVVELSVPRERVRRVEYAFAPEQNHVLAERGPGRGFDALLGGFSYWTHTSEAGWNFPGAPEWQREGDGWRLHFRRGDYLLVPAPVFSCSAFSLRLEFRRSDALPGKLLDTIRGRLPVGFDEEGHLAGEMVTRLGRHAWRSADPVPAGAWQTLEMVYDLQQLRVYVNGKEVAAVAASGRFSEGWLLSVGGGPRKGESGPPFDFRGDVRGLSLSNYPERR